MAKEHLLVTGYHLLESLYCVTATYESNEGRHVPFFSGKVIAVHNYANNGKVNGPNTNANNMTLCARAVNDWIACKREYTQRGDLTRFALEPNQPL